MDLYDPVKKVRIEVKNKKDGAINNEDEKFLKDVINNPDDTVYIYINMANKKMLSRNINNIYFINGI